MRSSVFSTPQDNLTEISRASEGTLAAIFSAELKSFRCPSEKGLGLIFFASVAEAMQATVELLDFSSPPRSNTSTGFCSTRPKASSNSRRRASLLELDEKPCESILLVEFQRTCRGKLAALGERQLGLRTTICANATEMALVWAMRKAGLSLAHRPARTGQTRHRHRGRRGAAATSAGLCRRTGIDHAPARSRSLLLRPRRAGLLHVRPVLDLHSATT